MTITYKPYLGGIYVILDGKTVGTIEGANRVQGVPTGYQYRPKGSKDAGEVFPTINAVKRSIEAE